MRRRWPDRPDHLEPGIALGITRAWHQLTFNLCRPTGTFTVEISAYLGTVLVDDLRLTAT